MTRACLVPLIALVCAAPVAAQTPPPSTQPATPPEQEYPIVRVGVLSYLQYDWEIENRDGFNVFDITRGYINVTGQLSKRFRFRLTPDVRRATDSSLSGSLVLRLKYGYLQVDNVLAEGAWLRFGLHQTPWLDFEESINRYRVQGQMFTEREGLIPGSGDFGAGYRTPFLDGYGELQAGVYNGEGFGQTEVNKFKSVQARVTVRPFPKRGAADGLRVSGFVNAGWYAADQPRRLWIVMGSYEHKHVAATLQYADATERPVAAVPEIDRHGTSLFVEARQGLTGWAAIARAETFTPDTAVGDAAHRRYIGGVAYWTYWSRVRLGFVLDDEIVDYDAGANRPRENRLLFQTHVEF